MSGSELAERVRRVHGMFPTGITVVTVKDDRDEPRGLAVNAFSSISLNPPMVLVSISTTSSTMPWLFGAEVFGINVLSDVQADVVNVFAQSGGEKFDNIEWHDGNYGAPLLAGCTATLELSTSYKIQAYTHVIFIGQVLSADVSSFNPMIYWNGKLFESSMLTDS